MVSLQPTLSPNRRKAITEYENLSKKRKLQEGYLQTQQIFEGESTKLSSVDHIELHLESPLPLEWQRCLDIQSGEIHFYNTRTQKRTYRDPRRKSPEPAASPNDDDDDHVMSLELQLNPPCHHAHAHNKPTSIPSSHDPFVESRRQKKNLAAFDEGDNKEQEMIATVCTRCHMLVMLCKSSPACPNCKFMHPLDQGPPTPFKRRCSTFLC